MSKELRQSTRNLAQMNALCEKLRIHIPILQAPPGSIAGPELAAVVSNAGGLGSMGLTWTDAESARRKVTQALSLTKRPFGVNFVLAFEDLPLLPALEAGAPLVTFSWGIPFEQTRIARDFGARVGIQVGNVEQACKAAELEPDFLICQGIEAGGHVQSNLELFDYLRRTVDLCGSIPVIAAGGIADGLGIARAMALGAQGAMLGTRFVATVESLAHEEYKRQLLLADAGDTVFTRCFSDGWPNAPHRVLRNRTLTAWEDAGRPPSGTRPGENDVTGFTESGIQIMRYEDTAPRIGMTGNVEEMALYSGTGVGSIDDLPRAGDLVARLWSEARAIASESADSRMDKRSHSDVK